MISTMGDKDGNAKGEFILLDKNFECIGTWTSGETALCGYDFWYQPYFNLMIASEWGAPKLFRRGFTPEDVKSDRDYGRRLNVYAWNERKLIDTIHLGDEGEAHSQVKIFPFSLSRWKISKVCKFMFSYKLSSIYSCRILLPLSLMLMLEEPI
jgi:methanethiol oxidase